MEETQVKTQGHENLIPWKKGDPSPNPSGRPKGQRNYSVIYREALIKIGAARNMTPEELEDLLVQSGLLNAMKGNYKFYQDFLDRNFGKPKQALEFPPGYRDLIDVEPQPSSIEKKDRLEKALSKYVEANPEVTEAQAIEQLTGISDITRGAQQSS